MTRPTSDGPLSGYRILDMGWSWAGPYAGMILADLGAEVIKVETSTRIDILRWSGSFSDDVRSYERSGYYGACNRGKKSAALNLKHPEAREVLLSLVEQADALIENFAPRVMPSLDLGYDVLSQRNPRLVMLSMSGYGASGPERDYVSYGDHLLHGSGIASITGDEGDPDTKIGIFYGDTVGGMYGAMAILAGLRSVERTGKGTHVELSQLEGLVSMIPVPLLREAIGDPIERSSDKSKTKAPHGFYRCEGTDAWVALSVRTDEEWRALAGVLASDGVDLPEASSLDDRLRQQEQIDAAISSWTATRSPWQVTDALQAVKVPSHPVLNSRDALNNDHLRERGFFPVVRHRISGPGPVPGVTFRYADDGARVRGPAPILGEHNEYVYRELLGMSQEQFESGVATGLIC